jgi:hypothetical protein
MLMGDFLVLKFDDDDNRESHMLSGGRHSGQQKVHRHIVRKGDEELIVCVKHLGERCILGSRQFPHERSQLVHLRAPSPSSRSIRSMSGKHIFSASINCA